MSRVETIQRRGAGHDLAFADQHGRLMQRLSASQRDGAGSDRRARYESHERSGGGAKREPDRVKPQVTTTRRISTSGCRTWSAVACAKREPARSVSAVARNL